MAERPGVTLHMGPTRHNGQEMRAPATIVFDADALRRFELDSQPRPEPVAEERLAEPDILAMFNWTPAQFRTARAGHPLR